MRIWHAAAVLLLGSPVLSPLALSQLAPSPDAPPVSSAPAQAQDEQSVATFKLQVNLVDMFFTVKDKQGNLVPHLTKDDCTVLEDKVPQKLKQDEAFLLSFDVNVDLLQDYTNSPRLLTRAMDKAQINTAAGNGAGGIPGAGGGTIPTIGAPKGTLLYDAVYLASNEKMSQETGRKAMILLTDGEDEGSVHKIQDAIAAAQRSNVIVYTILIADRGMFGGYGAFGYTGFSAMKKMTEETGGRLIDVGNNGKKLQDAFQQIEDELRTQYVATYTPSNIKLDGTFRHVSVECKGDGMKVQVRKGYYATAPQDNQ